ncbi:MAG: phosphoribosylformylglycinamidine synthase subunit PurS [Chloroflexi bacterium]|nr:phosphoribosylformylglycinamidine synthase subunit PurS [Chloroflexota bacterium]
MWKAEVIVMLKPVVNDPQGLTILGALRDLGFGSVQQVRAGKFFAITLDAKGQAEAEEALRQMCDQLLANPVIDDYRFTIHEATSS